MSGRGMGWDPYPVIWFACHWSIQSNFPRAAFSSFFSKPYIKPHLLFFYSFITFYTFCNIMPDLITIWTWTSTLPDPAFGAPEYLNYLRRRMEFSSAEAAAVRQANLRQKLLTNYYIRQQWWQAAALMKAPIDWQSAGDDVECCPGCCIHCGNCAVHTRTAHLKICGRPREGL